MKRREFINLTSQAGMLALLGSLNLPRLARAATPGKFTNLIYVHFNAGWDVVLGLDPQINRTKLEDRALFLGYRPEEIIQAEGLKLGPAALPLKPLSSNCVVVNG